MVVIGVFSSWFSPSARGRSQPQAAVSIEQLVREHGAFVWRSVRRLGVNEGDVDDVTQAVFLKARERLDEITADSARGFLYRLALGLASNHKRGQRRRREQSLPDEDAPAEGASADGIAAQLEARALVDRLLEPLDLDLRAVLVLHEAEELTAPEIAELLNIPVGTVASRLRRAREEARAALQREQARHPELRSLR